jgi:hypothetical protein
MFAVCCKKSGGFELRRKERVIVMRRMRDMPGKPSLLVCLCYFKFTSVDPAQNTAELIRMATCWLELVTLV